VNFIVLLRYALVSQLVIVVADWYGRPAIDSLSLPALSQLTRFGVATPLPHGWRAWLAAAMGRRDLAALAPGAVAAAAKDQDAPAHDTVAWLTSALHLTASLTTVHLDYTGLLRLDPATQTELAASFDEHFAERGYRLEATRAGGFLTRGPPPAADVDTTDPARCLGSSVAEALPHGPGAVTLRRLSGEIEMWLHEHAINRARALEGRVPISALWAWGGGRPLERHAGSESASAITRAMPQVFSDDPYVEGLCRTSGIQCAPAPQTLASVLSVSAPHRIATVEIFRPLAAGTLATPLDALASLDRDWVRPALDALNRREVRRICVVANDRCVWLSARDRLKFWRSARGALERLG
jgi:hypothetical protein